MNELALFAGAGGGILGGHLLGWRTRCAVEFAPHQRSVLLARQRDKLLPSFPVWDDVRTFDGKPWRGRIDVVSGGFPCTDISAAGKGAGIEGEHSGLWGEMARIVGEVRPRFVFVENSPLLVKRGLAVVIGDLTKMGYDSRWCCVSASDLGAPHERDRFWLVADSERDNDRWPNGAGWRIGKQSQAETHGDGKDGHWEIEPALDRVVDAMALKLDKTHTSQLRCLGNGQVPLVAAAAWRILTHNVKIRG